MACDSDTTSTQGPGTGPPGGGAPGSALYLSLPSGSDWITSGASPLGFAGSVQPLDGGVPPALLNWTRLHPDGDATGTVSVDLAGGFEFEVPLLPGDNELLFSGGAEELGRLMVTHNPGFELSSELSAVFGNTGTALAFTGTPAVADVALELADPLTDPERVRLVRMYAGEELPFGLFSDMGEGLVGPGPQGEAPTGDQIAGDGRFATRVFLGAKAPGVFRVRAVIGLVDGGEARSEAIDLAIAPPFQAEDLAPMFERLDEWRADLLEAEIAGTLIDALRDVEQELAMSDLIVESGFDSEALQVWYVTRAGVAGVIELFEFGAKGRATPLPAGAPIGAGDAAGEELPSGPAGAMPPIETGAPIGSRRVLTLAPFAFEFGELDDAAQIAELYAADGRFDVESIAADTPGKFPLESLQDLETRGVVHLSTHGTQGFRGLSPERAESLGFLPGAPVTVLNANAAATVDSVESLAAWFVEGRLVMWTSQDGPQIAMSPTYLGQGPRLPRTLVSLSACRSIDAGPQLLGRGAAGLLAFAGCVPVAFTGTVLEPLQAALLDGAELGAAFTPGQLPPGATEGELLALGDLELALGAEELLDGSFECETPAAAWDAVGELRSLVRLGQVRPTGARRMGALFVHAAGGSAVARATQTFQPGPLANLLRFDWRVASAELAGGASNDVVRAWLRAADGGSEEYELLFEPLSGLSGAAEPLDVTLEGQLAAVTPWAEFEIELPEELLGRRIELEFELQDVAGDGRPGALLLDRIRTP